MTKVVGGDELNSIIVFVKNSECGCYVAFAVEKSDEYIWILVQFDEASDLDLSEDSPHEFIELGLQQGAYL
jgi:hypothetical protein